MSNLISIDDQRSAEIIWGVSAVGTVLTVLVHAATPYGFDSLDEMFAYRRALQTGNLPERIDLREWRRRLRRSQLALGWKLLLFFPFVVFGVMSADSSHSPYRVMLVWMFVIVGIWSFAPLFIASAKIRQLNSELKQLPESVIPAADAQMVPEKWVRFAETSTPTGTFMLAATATVMALVSLVLADLERTWSTATHALPTSGGSWSAPLWWDS